MDDTTRMKFSEDWYKYPAFTLGLIFGFSIRITTWTKSPRFSVGLIPPEFNYPIDLLGFTPFPFQFIRYRLEADRLALTDKARSGIMEDVYE